MTIHENYSLKPLHTFGLDVHARYFVPVRSAEEFLLIRESEAYRKSPLLLLGGGSNMLFRGNLDRLVVRVEVEGKTRVKEDEHSVYLQVGAGTNWHELVQYCISHNWGGIENLSLIPGTTGAAPIQNIGAYGTELEQVFHSLEAIHLESGEVQTFSHNDCQFGYRDSFFKREGKGKYLITRVTLRLSKQPKANVTYRGVPEMIEQIRKENTGTDLTAIQEVSAAITRIRQQKLPNPATIGNAGSFFKNPVISKEAFARLQAEHPGVPHYPVSNTEVKVPAAWLIDQCGWKGYRKNDAGIHDKQALVLVNHGRARGEDLVQLACAVQDDVARRFNISLHPEVNII